MAAFVIALSWLMALPCVSSAAADIPAHIPRYDLGVRIDTHAHVAHIRQRVTWTNTTRTPTPLLVFNFYPHYRIPAGDYVLLAKTLEMLRLQPSLGIDRGGRHGVVESASLLTLGGKKLDTPAALPFEFDNDNPSTLRFKLPQPVGPGETVSVELDCTIHLPNKQGRWGHWDGVTFLTNALPLLAFHDDTGWRPMPFVPWHQPWFNEAGEFRATIDLPADEVLACPAVTRCETPLADGWKRVETEPFVGRDFALLCSKRYKEFLGETVLPDGRTVRLRCLAFAEHEFYAAEILKIAAHAIPVYSAWFGAYPYSQFTVAESYFGWNGNECAGLVMIDERVFGMPHLATGYVEYLVSHETCHQWWYNLVGTNGYSEPFMDEGAATYFTHRMLDQKRGKNNALLTWPDGLKWLPNINRENYRYGGLYAAIRNGQMHPAAQDLPEYGHLYGLFTGAYDRGSKVFGMIEAQLGEAAFLDFTRLVVAKYGWRVLEAADYRRELEAYTGRDWGQYFDRWVYGKGLTDWELVRVEESVEPVPRAATRPAGWHPTGPTRRVTLLVRQTRAFDEPTTIRVATAGGGMLTVPLLPTNTPLAIPEHNTRITPVGDHTWKVTLDAPGEVEQVRIDPDNVLLDADPGNNAWHPHVHARVTPLYTMLDETDLTSDPTAWNVLAGPWVWGASYPDPWYTRSTMVGLRAGVNRPQKLRTGVYAAYRTDFRDIVLGADAIIPGRMQETGFNYEVRVGGPYGRTDGAGSPQRASAYHRWVLKQSSSLYLHPMVYHEVFANYEDNFLPFARNFTPGAERWQRAWTLGWHFRANLYTPYWDPETGMWFDFSAGAGQVELQDWEATGNARAELAGVQSLPDWAGPLRHARVAARVLGQGAFPDRAQLFALGGGRLFRGYDLAERQGSALWVGNLELRYPVVQNVIWDALDHTIGARNVWVVGFYDVGDVYANGRSVGGQVAHALGVGGRVDVAIFSFIERATLRFDVAKTVNDNTPFQFWFGVQHAF